MEILQGIGEWSWYVVWSMLLVIASLFFTIYFKFISMCY